jgi:hypothetical protein
LEYSTPILLRGLRKNFRGGLTGATVKGGITHSLLRGYQRSWPVNKPPLGEKIFKEFTHNTILPQKKTLEISHSMR